MIERLAAFDDKQGSKHGFKSDHLLGFLAVMDLDIESRENRVTLWENIQRGLSTFVSVYELERTPIQVYLTNYERVC
jgi:hypothetical protein